MKKVVALLLVFAFAVGTIPAYAAPRGASSTAMEKASDEAIFHRVGDWFATVGKSSEEKQAILAERKAKRAAAKAQKQAAKAQKELQKKMKATKKSFGR